MKQKKQEKKNYTIEREFLGKYTVEELLNRVIRAHLKRDGEDGGGRYE